jgi:hypothetical protein
MRGRGHRKGNRGRTHPQSRHLRAACTGNSRSLGCTHNDQTHTSLGCSPSCSRTYHRPSQTCRTGRLAMPSAKVEQAPETRGNTTVPASVSCLIFCEHKLQFQPSWHTHLLLTHTPPRPQSKDEPHDAPPRCSVHMSRKPSDTDNATHAVPATSSRTSQWGQPNPGAHCDNHNASRTGKMGANCTPRRKDAHT